MKKLLLLATVAMTASAVWAFDNPLGTEKVYELIPANGSLYRGGAVASTGTWSSQWKSTDKEPEVIFSTNVNNIMEKANGDLVFASGSSKSCTYTFTANNDNWYVAKIEFDCVSAGDDGPRIVVGEEATMLSTTLQHYEHEFAYDEDAVFHLNGENNQVTTSNFFVTVRKMAKEDIADRIIKKYSFAEFGALWTVEAANEVNDAIMAKAESYKDTETDVEAVSTDLRALAEQQLVDVLLPLTNNKYVTFKDRYTERFMAAYKAGETDGETEITADCSRMITNGDDMHAIWRITYDTDAKRIRFHHYMTDLDLGNNNLNNTVLPVYDHSELSDDAPGALFTLRPMRIHTSGNTIYIVEMEDNTNAADHLFIHDNTSYSGPIKWNTAETSPGSGWFVTVLDINPDGELAGLLDLKNKPVVIIDMDTNKYLTKIDDTHAGYIDELTPAAIWNVNIEDEDHFENGEIQVKHVVSGLYINDLNKELEQEPKSSLKVIDYVDEHASWYVVDNRELNVAPEGYHHFSINEVSAEQKAQIMEALLPNVRFELGNVPGTYSFGNESDDAAYNELKDKVDAINGEEEFDYVAADAIYNLQAPAIYDMNALTAPALVRIKTAPVNITTVNAYITNSNNNNVVGFDWDPSAAEAENTIFVLHEGQLSAYVGGSYMLSESANVPKMWEESFDTENEGLTMNFVDGTESELGAYLLNYDNDGSSTPFCFLYCGTGVPARSRFSDIESSKHHSQTPNLSYNVEFVNQLTVNVDGDYKLWRSPVTVNFGDYADNGAYVVEVKNNTISTEAAEAETNYGAGTVFLLTKNIIVTCVNGDNTVAKTAGLGHHAVKNHTFSPDKVYLTIHEDQSPEPAPETQGLYYDTPEGAQQVRLLVKKVNEETTETIPAHTPVIEAEPTADAELNDGDAIMLPLGGSTDTTEIMEITGVKKAAEGIYDLQGRRLAAPVKGLNIINGKKTMVK
ncbi:MAG: hypothetical protein K2K82_09130 [Muribaculaceae bacterium]|nr:hypothetical protein [Muribaculaceae bacterium]